MAGHLLTSATVATCPHGAPVAFTPSQSRVLADGAPVLLVSDQATVTGCPFVVGTVASPCVTVRWVAPSTRVRVTDTLVLLSTSVGLCHSAASVPQGLVQLSSHQTRVQGT